jgi:hypothetical protein
MLGRHQGITTFRDRQFLADEKRIQCAIEKDPKFRKLDISKDSEGQAIVSGTLPSKVAQQQLRRLLIRQGGEEWADRCSKTVALAQSPGVSSRVEETRVLPSAH